MKPKAAYLISSVFGGLLGTAFYFVIGEKFKAFLWLFLCCIYGIANGALIIYKIQRKYPEVLSNDEFGAFRILMLNSLFFFGSLFGLVTGIFGALLFSTTFVVSFIKIFNIHARIDLFTIIFSIILFSLSYIGGSGMLGFGIHIIRKKMGVLRPDEQLF